VQLNVSNVSLATRLMKTIAEDVTRIDIEGVEIISEGSRGENNARARETSYDVAPHWGRLVMPFIKQH